MHHRRPTQFKQINVDLLKHLFSKENTLNIINTLYITILWFILGLYLLMVRNKYAKCRLFFPVFGREREMGNARLHLCTSKHSTGVFFMRSDESIGQIQPKK